MRLNSKIYIIIFLLVLAYPIQARSPVQLGEKLEYEIWYNFVKGGQSWMEVSKIDTIDDRPCFHIINVTRSTGVVDLLFSIDDKLETWIDPQTHYSYKFQKRIREGKYKKDYNVVFNYQDSIAISNSDTTAIKPPIHDAISIFYYLRKTKLDTGKVFKVNNFDSDTLKHYDIKVTGQEKVKVPAGEFNCFKLEPFSEEGKLFEKHENKVVTYISQDSLRLPVKITSQAKFGQLVLKLKEVKN